MTEQRKEIYKLLTYFSNCNFISVCVNKTINSQLKINLTTENVVKYFGFK